MDTRDNDPTEPQPTEPPTEGSGESGAPPQQPGEAAQEPAGTAGGSGANAAPSPRRLTRSADDRVVAGVCGGIARYFGVDSTLIRIAAVALTLFGGAGALLYLAGLVLMPGDSTTATAPGAAEPADRPRALVVVGVVVLLLIGWPFLIGGGFLIAGLAVPLAVLALAGLLVWWLVSGEGPGGSGADVARRAALGIGVLILCGLVAVGGGLAAGLGGGTLVAVLVVLAGVALVVGAFVGGARWLILPALSLALSVGFVSAAGIDFHGGVGEREYRPASAAAVRDSYRIGMGELVVDLRNADLPAGDTRLALDVGVGEARLIVPEDVCVASVAEVGVGAIDVFDLENGGVDLDWEERPRAASGGSRVVVDADVGLGALVVNHNGSEERDRGPRFGRSFGDDDDQQDVGNVGCRGTRAAR